MDILTLLILEFIKMICHKDNLLNIRYIYQMGIILIMILIKHLNKKWEYIVKESVLNLACLIASKIQINKMMTNKKSLFMNIINEIIKK